jgi:hypothetical protein
MQPTTVRSDRTFHARPILIGMAAGLVVALATLFAWEAIPRETSARRVFDAVFYPEYLAVDRLTDWLSPQNRDAGIRYWLFVHPAYCVLAGGLIGLGVACFRRSIRKRART